MKARSGFTVLELAVSIAIGVIIIMMLGAIFLAQAQLFDVQGAVAQTQINAFQAIDTVGLYASSAKDVVASAVINGTTYTSSTNTVVFEIPSIDSSGTIISGTYDDIALGLNPANSSQFIFDIDSATASTRISGKYVKASLVDKLIFRYNATSPSAATVVDLFIQTIMTTRGQTIRSPLEKLYYLGTT